MFVIFTYPHPGILGRVRPRSRPDAIRPRPKENCKAKATYYEAETRNVA